MGGGVGRASVAGVERLLTRFFLRGAGRGRAAGVADLEGTVEDLSGGADGMFVGGCDRCLATLLSAFTGGAGGSTGGSSEHRWEPGSARVPTFCTLFCPPGRASGDGDLPLPGDGGGEPNRESDSKSSCWSAMSPPCIARGYETCELVRSV